MNQEEQYIEAYEEKRKAYYRKDEPLRETNDLREIGRDAVWTLSSAKTGNGVDQIRDDCIETFWQ